MRKIEFEVGHKFSDMLTYTGNEKKEGITRFLEVECSCGNVVFKRMQYLRSGAVTHCGCKTNKVIRSIAEGYDFGGFRATGVVVRNPKTKVYDIEVECKHCGSISVKTYGNLTRRQYASCGCLKNGKTIPKASIKDLEILCKSYGLDLDLKNKTINGKKIFYHIADGEWYFKDLQKRVRKVVYNLRRSK